ncbi:MAG: MATE family efflux transporter [Ruminococcus sp.]|nr:MATE family efflux transporter [Ruminococcus sp.]
MLKSNENKKYQMDMCSGPVLRKMLAFALPLMCSSILQLLFNAADIVVVGRFAGDNSLAAVGSNTALINLLTNLFVGLSIGANVTSALCYGAKKWDDLKKTVHTAMLLSLCSGILLTIIGIAGAKQILIWMQTPAEILELATVYLRIYFLGMSSLMIYNFGSAILRSIGDTRRPLYYLLAAGVINVVLNLFFVIVFNMDVAGVALATVISETVSAALVVRCMMKESDESGIRLELKSLRIDPDKLKKIFRIGLPAGFQGIIFSISNVVIQSSINSFGKIVVAGNSAAANVEGFVYMSMNAFHQSTLSFTSQNLGAGKIKRINKILFSGLICVTVTGLLLGNAAVFFGDTLLGIYSDSTEVIEAGMQRLLIICTTYALCGIMDVIVGSLRGIGCSIMPMIVSLIGVCGLRLAWLFTFFRQEQFHSPEMIYITYPVSWIITIAVHVVCYIIVKRRLDRRYADIRET